MISPIAEVLTINIFFIEIMVAQSREICYGEKQLIYI